VIKIIGTSRKEASMCRMQVFLDREIEKLQSFGQTTSFITYRRRQRSNLENIKTA